MLSQNLKGGRKYQQLYKCRCWEERWSMLGTIVVLFGTECAKLV